MEVYKTEIVKAICENNLTTLEEVQDVTEASTGCGSCAEEIDKILSELRNGN